MGTKINQLIQQLPAGTILLSAWLKVKLESPERAGYISTEK